MSLPEKILSITFKQGYNLEQKAKVTYGDLELNGAGKFRVDGEDVSTEGLKLQSTFSVKKKWYTVTGYEEEKEEAKPAPVIKALPRDPYPYGC